MALTDDRVFADGRIQHPAGKFLGEILRGFEGAAKLAHVLPVDIDARIFREGARLGFANGFEIGDHAIGENG